MSTIPLDDDQAAMLRGEKGQARQMAMRLVLDMAAAAGADSLTPIDSAHLSGVSPLTGGLGLRQFLAKLAADPEAQVAVPTTLNAAGCDATQFDAMRIAAPDFLAHSQEIVALYTQLGVRPTKSCIPYEWEGVVIAGQAAWSESNAICFGNSYTGLATNRESGLSALAAALTGCTPRYGLLLPENRRPNLLVDVACRLDDPTDFSILGDWIGTQRTSDWQMPLGPIPLISGLPTPLSHDQRKALSAAAANYGCALLYVEGEGEVPAPDAWQGHLRFDAATLAERYDALAPRDPVSLVVLGCPQASVSELRAIAEQLRGRRVVHAPEAAGVPVWVFTSAANLAIAERTGLADLIRSAGALLLSDTCPEVVPYDQQWVHHILTNSMKAEHYIKSGLNGVPTSVMTLAGCIAAAAASVEEGGRAPVSETSNAGAVTGRPSTASLARGAREPEKTTMKTSSRATPDDMVDARLAFIGAGLPSQSDFDVRGEAFVTDAPITLLGFVNRETGVIEEPGHPADGESLAGRIAVFPRGSGSTVAPYVLLELLYRGNGPLAVVNTAIDQQTAPACSLEAIPYGYGFDRAVLHALRTGDIVELSRRGEELTLRLIERRP
jgi:predicted aconitase/predicted aconitase with swiveling domain